MLGESWALFRSDPHNEVDSITPDHSLAQTHNFARTLSFCPRIPFCPNYRGPRELAPLPEPLEDLVCWSSDINHFPKWKIRDFF